MKFSDLRLCVPVRDMEQVKKMIAKSSELGYDQIGVPLPLSMREESVGQLRQISEDYGLDFVTRLDIVAKSSSELLGSLRRFRRRFEVLSVSCNSKQLARLAARDRRVDLLRFPSLESRKLFFDWAEAELASKSSAAFEIDATRLLGAEGFTHAGLFSRLRKEVSTAKSFGVPMVISSGATEPLLLRKPHDYASLALLFDMSLSLALEAMSKHPLDIVERNRQKQSSRYVSPGIRIVKEKKSVEVR
jgi:RNase P/RNase MRP subunit p30